MFIPREVVVADRSLSYADAVRLLEDADSPVVATLDRLVGGVLDVVPGGKLIGLPFFAFREQLVAYGNKLVSSIRDRVTGLGRYDRTQRLVAAHTVIVVTAFWDAVGELTDTDTQVSADEARELQTRLASMLTGGVPEPGTGWAQETRRGRAHDWYFVALVGLRPLSATSATFAALPLHKLSSVPDLALRRYEEYYRLLAADVPEFAIWTSLGEHRATREGVERLGGELRDRLDALDTGLAGIPEILEHVSGRAAANRVRTELASGYQAMLTRSVLAGAQAPDGIVLPSLARGYVNPACRVAVLDSAARPSEESWWADQSLHDDGSTLIVGALAAPQAVESPLVVLGQPGAGKSVLTRGLAARLVDRGFLPVRVELRGVPAEADVQEQIEHAVREATGRRIDWPDLAASATEDGLLPLVILDGFDELLQATGVSRSDYLEGIARFQRRERDLHRPVAVLVTARTVVADRVRFPDGCLALRLEPFDEHRVRVWTEVWNEFNAAPLAGRGLHPLSADLLIGYGELASQPLLLTLLALYDADRNELQAAGAELSRAELYERLLTEFARREARKAGTLDPEDEAKTVESELHSLALVALAMFNRGAQVITAAQLDGDLAALRPSASPAAGTDLAKPLTAAQLTVGRFYFVHESRAVRDGETEHGYEFLHATFGEFLIARYVFCTVRLLAEDRVYQARRGRREPLDDGELWVALSFALLSSSAAIVEFVEGLFGGCADADRKELRELLVELRHAAPYPNEHRSLSNYEPDRLPMTIRDATYFLNLAVLAVLAVDVPLEFTGIEARLLRNALYDVGSGVLDVVRYVQAGQQFGTVAALVRETGADISLYESGWSGRFWYEESGADEVLFGDVTFPAGREAGELMRREDGVSGPLMRHSLAPYFQFVGDGVRIGVQDGSDVVLLARALLELRLAPISASGATRRKWLYRCCIDNAPGRTSSPGFLPVVLRQLREDVRELEPRVVADLIWYAAERGVLDTEPDGYIDVLTALRDASANAYLSVVMLLKDKVDDVPDEAARTRLRALVIHAEDRRG